MMPFRLLLALRHDDAVAGVRWDCRRRCGWPSDAADETDEQRRATAPLLPPPGPPRFYLPYAARRYGDITAGDRLIYLGAPDYDDLRILAAMARQSDMSITRKQRKSRALAYGMPCGAPETLIYIERSGQLTRAECYFEVSAALESADEFAAAALFASNGPR